MATKFPVALQSEVEARTTPADVDAKIAEALAPRDRYQDGGVGFGKCVIAGHTANAIATDLHDSTVAGGGHDGRENVIGASSTANVGTDTPNTPTAAGSGADYATIGGGYDNVNNGLASTIAGGAHHKIEKEANHATIAGGSFHSMLRGSYHTIGGGTRNTINTDPSGGGGDTAGCTIGGGQSNSISGITNNATVGGGSSNQVVGAINGTVGGGAQNQVTGATGTVGGGSLNVASGAQATVGGGTQNTAGGGQATVAGGAVNSASGSQATVAGGGNNAAAGNNSTVGGGTANNVAAGSSVATIAGGSTNTIGAGASGNGVGATISGGQSNAIGAAADADYATIPGGQGNSVDAPHATAMGQDAKASIAGAVTQAYSKFATAGDAQTTVAVVKRQTTTATTTALRGGSAINKRLSIPDDTTWLFSALIVARRTDVNGENAAYKIEGCIKRDSGAASTALVGTPAVTVIAEDTAAWNVAAAKDSTNGALDINVTGEAGKTINWVARVTLVEVTG